MVSLQTFNMLWLTMENDGGIKVSSDMSIEQWGASDYRRYKDKNGDRYMKMATWLDGDYDIRAGLVRQGSVKVESL